MSARETEDKLQKRCAEVARGLSAGAQNQQEANVFRLASMVIQSRHPSEAARLMQAGEEYFFLHPDQRLAAADVIRRGWVFSLPRLRDMLALQLR